MSRPVLTLNILVSVLLNSLTIAHPLDDHLATRATDASGCVNGVYVISARGTGDPPGDGKLEPMAVNITHKIPHSTLVALVYPATDPKQSGEPYPHAGEAYNLSEQTGCEDLIKKLGRTSTLVAQIRK